MRYAFNSKRQTTHGSRTLSFQTRLVAAPRDQRERAIIYSGKFVKGWVSDNDADDAAFRIFVCTYMEHHHTCYFLFVFTLWEEIREHSVSHPISELILLYDYILSSVWFWSLRQFVWTEQTMSIVRYFGVLSYYLNVTAAIGANNETAKCRSA